MTSRERILAAWSGQPYDHVPLTTWCFGLRAPAALRWRKPDGREVAYWYSLRMEHIHTTPQPWDLDDDLQRALAWRSLGVDDILDVSVPWSTAPGVTWRDSVISAGGPREHPVLVRDYRTPAGPLRHAVATTEEDQGEGWVVQPDTVALFEDLNVPRAVEHAVGGPADVAPIRCLYAPPDDSARAWFAERMARVRPFAEERGLAVQAWAAFGMDAAVWLAGVEGAVMMALEEPAAFGELLDIIAEADAARVELAASTPGVDLIVQRGWYSATDFWSPRLFDRLVLPRVRELADLAHRRGRKYAYVATTGVELLGPRLADAGVDVLFFLDPTQDRISLDSARGLAERGLTLIGGINATSLVTPDRDRITREVSAAIETLGPTHHFILHPLDALFPDTPWEGVEMLIEAWRGCQGL